MGLDILVFAVVGDDYEINSHDQALSREFCTLMCHFSDKDSNSELRQISHLTGIDVGPLRAMDNYILAEELAEELEFTDVANRAKVIERAKKGRASVHNNLDTIADLLSALLIKLPAIDNLPDLLTPSYKEDYLHNEYYFADFQLDKGDGYIRNNFGQDLRHFKAFLDYAKGLGSQTVFFHYG